KLLRVEAVPDKVTVGGAAIQMPGMIAWLDGEREMVRSEMELPGLGKVTLYRTTKAIAQVDIAAPALLRDLGLTTLIRLNRAVPRPHAARSMVYPITVEGDDAPSTTFTKDARQQVKNVEGSTFELHVRAVRRPRPKEDPPKAKPEFLASSHFLDCKDERIQE